jgi:S1-C subfamily serine protease
VLIRLAAVALQDSAPAGAESEHSAAVVASQLLRARQQAQASALARLFPSDLPSCVRLGVGLACLVGLLALMLLSGPATADKSLFASHAAISSLDQDQEIAKAVGMVVCGMTARKGGGDEFDIPLSMGSCVAVSPTGHLLTNKHVIESVWKLEQPGGMWHGGLWGDVTARPTVWVFFGREKYVAKILHVSERHDLGILKVERTQGPCFRLSRSQDLPRGAKVAACGFPGAAAVPLSDEEEESLRRKVMDLLTGKTRGRRIEEWFKPRDFEYVRTDGAVSRVVAEEQGRSWVQHTAAVSPGNSGGPLLTERGHVVGINTRLAVGSQGIFYALSLPQLKDEIDRHAQGAIWE